MSQDSPEMVCESTHSVRTLNTPVMIYTGYLLVIVLPTNCVSLPGKYFIPLSLSVSLSSVQILAFFQYKSPYQTTRYY